MKLIMCLLALAACNGEEPDEQECTPGDSSQPLPVFCNRDGVWDVAELDCHPGSTQVCNVSVTQEGTQVCGCSQLPKVDAFECFYEACR